jgi:hypothetical protein
MKKDLYNSTNKEFNHVIKLLKELPKEQAPDNFEYNLLTKIKNKNFATNIPEKKTFYPWKIFIPATAGLVASLIVFTTFFNESDSLENPFQIEPKLRNEIGSTLLSSSNLISNLGNNSKISENDVVINEKLETEISEDNLKVNEKLVAEKTQINAESPSEVFTFDNYNSTNLDEVLGEKRNSPNFNRRAQLVGNNNSSSFNGFYIREEVDKKYVETMKAKMDSLKKEFRNKKINMKIAQ